MNQGTTIYGLRSQTPQSVEKGTRIKQFAYRAGHRELQLQSSDLESVYPNTAEKRLGAAKGGTQCKGPN